MPGVRAIGHSRPHAAVSRAVSQASGGPSGVHGFGPAYVAAASCAPLTPRSPSRRRASYAYSWTLASCWPSSAFSGATADASPAVPSVNATWRWSAGRHPGGERRQGRQGGGIATVGDEQRGPRPRVQRARGESRARAGGDGRLHRLGLAAGTSLGERRARHESRGEVRIGYREGRQLLDRSWRRAERRARVEGRPAYRRQRIVQRRDDDPECSAGRPWPRVHAATRRAPRARRPSTPTASAPRRRRRCACSPGRARSARARPLADSETRRSAPGRCPDRAPPAPPARRRPDPDPSPGERREVRADVAGERLRRRRGLRLRVDVRRRLLLATAAQDGEGREEHAGRSGHRPFHAGLRFSTNARGPSWKSSLCSLTSR